MNYQKDDKIRVNMSAAISGTFIAYDDKDSSYAKVQFEGITETVSVPLDSISLENYTNGVDDEMSLQLSNESKKELERQMQLINFSPKGRQ